MNVTPAVQCVLSRFTGRSGLMYSFRRSLYKLSLGQVTLSAPKLFTLLSFLWWSRILSFCLFRILSILCLFIFLPPSNSFLYLHHLLRSVIFHFPLSFFSHILQTSIQFQPFSRFLLHGGSSLRFFSQLLFLAGSQSALGGRWQPLKALSGLVSAAGEGGEAKRREEKRRGKFMQKDEEGIGKWEDGKERGGGGLKGLKSRGEADGGSPRFSPDEGCLTWVNSQLTALETDAKLLHSVVMVIHAGPAVSHCMRAVCVRVCVCVCVCAHARVCVHVYLAHIFLGSPFILNS